MQGYRTVARSAEEPEETAGKAAILRRPSSTVHQWSNDISETDYAPSSYATPAIPGSMLWNTSYNGSASSSEPESERAQAPHSRGAACVLSVCANSRICLHETIRPVIGLPAASGNTLKWPRTSRQNRTRATSTL